MPLSELVKKYTGMNFDIAAEEMRRLAEIPTEQERLRLYGLYKQAIHGDIPPEDEYDVPSGGFPKQKYAAWELQKGRSQDSVKAEYVKFAEEMIKKYGRKIVRNKWNSEVWSVDY